MVILVTDGLGEGNLGMVTTFCHHDQAKMEASDALSNLYQCDSLEQSVVVVRRYTNTPYIPHGSSCFLYLDVSTLSGGASSMQFSLDWLHLCRLLPYSDTEVGMEVFSYFQEALRQSSEDEHHLSDPILLLVLSSASPPHQEENTQMEEGSGFHPAIKCFQSTSQAKVQLECELAQETHGLAQRYENWQNKLARKHERQ